MAARIVVLGGGFAGVVAARSLKRRLGGQAIITVVDRRPRFAFTPSFVWLIDRERRPADIVRDRSALQRVGIDVRVTEITGLDLAERRVRTSEGDLAWDYLVVALGAETAPDRLPGLSAGGANLYTLDGPQRWADAIETVSGGDIAILVAGRLFKCPWAPYEAALVSDAVLRRRGVRSRCALHIYTPEERPMEGCGSGASQAMTRLLGRRGIAVHVAHQALEIAPAERRMRFGTGRSAAYDLLAAIPPHVPPRLLAQTGLDGPDGWIYPPDASLRTAVPGVYAVGDVTSLSIGGNGPLPKLGVLAHAGGEVAATNIAAEVGGTPPGTTLRSRLVGFIATGISRAALYRSAMSVHGGLRSHMTAPNVFWYWSKGAFERHFLRTWL